MACFVSCIYVLLNIPLGLIGLALVAVGACLQMSDTVMKPYLQPLLDQLPMPSGYSTSITTYLQPATIAFIIVGSLFVMLALFACIGLCCKGKKAAVLFFAIYAIFAIIFFLLFAALTVIIAVPKQFVGSYMKDFLNVTLTQQYVAVDSTDPTNAIWNLAQLGLQCCGVIGGADYKLAVKFNRTWITLPTVTASGTVLMSMTIPPSCCTSDLLSINTVASGSVSSLMKNAEALKGCVFDASLQYSNYAKGCYDALFDKYNEYQWYCLGPCIGICLILLFLVVVPIVFACKNKKQQALENKVAPAAAAGDGEPVPQMRTSTAAYNNTETQNSVPGYYQQYGYGNPGGVDIKVSTNVDNYGHANVVSYGGGTRR